MKAFFLFFILTVNLNAQEKPDSPKPVPASRMSKADRDAYLCKKYGGCEPPTETLKEAVFAKDMLPWEILYVASLGLDAATTQNCINNHDCHEKNPVAGNNTAQRYTLGTAGLVGLLYATGELRKHGHGTIAKGFLFVPSVVHIVLGINTIRSYNGHWQCSSARTCVYIR